MHKMSELHPVPIKPQLGTAESYIEENQKRLLQQPSKVVVLADLNVNPPEADGDDSVHVSAPDLTRFLSVLTLSKSSYIVQFSVISVAPPIFFFLFFCYLLPFVWLLKPEEKRKMM
jgi:hypothetical protein